ncbi:MAG: MAPEG family protein [Pseudomonadota bacterium]
MESNEILKPVALLAAWSLLMWFWMYVTRIPAMQAAGITPDPSLPNGQQMASLPARVRWKADNYNHLMEQPTVFYALAISLAVIGDVSGMDIVWAWAYLGTRVLHSLIQALWNKIEVRFLVFVLSNVPLFALTFSAVNSLFL